MNDFYVRQEKARCSVSWASELIWRKDGDEYVANGFQASYRLNRDHYRSWQCWVTRDDGPSGNAGWREGSLRAAKDAALNLEKRFAKEKIE